jgi:hypothetical protein
MLEFEKNVSAKKVKRRYIKTGTAESFLDCVPERYKKIIHLSL